MTAENCLLGAMDKLWFHQIILLSNDQHPKTPPKSVLFSKVIREIPRTGSHDVFEISAAQEVQIQKNHCDGEDIIARQTKLTEKEPKIYGRNAEFSTNRLRKLKKAKSCKSLGELELREVQGFMDLGFSFNKENLSKKLMMLIPGLQRVAGAQTFDFNDDDDRDEDDEEEEEEDDEERKWRPYLSEAWVIKRPDSPLLNLRIPTRASTAADMKKHLKYWARTVASAIQQES